MSNNRPKSTPVFANHRPLLPVYHPQSRDAYASDTASQYSLSSDARGFTHYTTHSQSSMQSSLPDYNKGSSQSANICEVEKPKLAPITTSAIQIPPASGASKTTPDSMERFLMWFDLYRKLFTIIMLFNIGVLIAVTRHKFGYAKKSIFSITLGNLFVSVLARNELALRVIYWLVVKSLWWTPIRIRNGITALLVNLGGVHSGCSTAGLMWACYAAYASFKTKTYPHVVLAFTILTPIALGISIAVALPHVRHQHHNVFERFHRFVGWLGLFYLWILVILLESWDIESRQYHPGRIDWVKKQEFWYSVLLSTMIVTPWLTMQKIPVKVSAPSAKTAFLTFPGGCYTGLLGRLSRSPWLEWHAFGIISEGPLAFTHHMLVVAQGDWTRALITDPPEFVWTRGLKFAGLPYLAEMYNRGVIVATGAGIGVTLSVCMQLKGYFHLIWIGSDMDKTYGSEIMGILRRAIDEERITLVDTKVTGRPDTVQLIDNIYRKIDAQVTFITSNPKGTEIMVQGCRDRGMTAFGPLFDS